MKEIPVYSKRSVNIFEIPLAKKIILLLKYLSAEHDIPFFVYDAFDHMAMSREEIGYARDRMHGGPGGHIRLAERMLDDWSKK